MAIKWMLPSAALDPSTIQRFLVEARTLARIDHPNVVGILDVGEEGGAPFLVMELLLGESLRERLTERGRLGLAETVDLLLPAMRGVAEAHLEGAIHRDLKPDNIFLCRSKDGRPREAKVVDFGISKLSEPVSAGGSLTKTGMTFGTPSYMSPEQLNALKAPDPRFDVYAMGIVLYECLTGQVPYRAEGLIELVTEIAGGRAVPPSQLAPGIPAALDHVVLTAMAAHPDARFASMDQLIEALEALRPGLVDAPPGALPAPGSGPATTPWPVPASGPFPRGPHGPAALTPYPSTTPLPMAAESAPSASAPPARSRLLLGAAGLGVLVAGSMAAFLWGLGPDDRPPPPPPPEVAVEAPDEAPPIAVPPSDPAEATAEPETPVTPATYASLLGAPDREGTPVSLAGTVAQQGEGGAFLLFVAELGCGGARACALMAREAPLSPPVGQAVRIHGAVSGTHAYRTRGGATREVPAVRVERLDSSLDASAVEETERPLEPGLERPAPRPTRTAPLVEPIAPRPLVTPRPPPPTTQPVVQPTPRPFRPVISSDEI